MFTFLHVSDVHGAGFGPDASGDCTLARIAAALRRGRAGVAPGTVFFTLGGDLGEEAETTDPLSRRAGALPLLLALRELGVDAATPGNHDFDHGLEALLAQVRASACPWLSANIYFKGTRRRVFGEPPWLIREAAGRRVAFFGLGPGARHKHNILNAAGAEVDVTDFLDEAAALVPELRRQCDLLVCLSHLGQASDEELAAAVPGIDLILGAHSHTVNPGTVAGNGTLIVQAGRYGAFVAKAETVWGAAAPAGWPAWRWTSELLHMQDEQPDPATVASLQGFVAQLDAGEPLPC